MGDDFENLYKGQISKSGTPILPSKRARKIPEKIQVSKEDLEELKQSSEPNVEVDTSSDTASETQDVSLDELKNEETTETSNSQEETE